MLGDCVLIFDVQDLLPISLTVAFYADVFPVSANVDLLAELMAVAA